MKSLNKLSNRLLIAALSMSVLLAPIARADAQPGEPGDACSSVVKACDKALADEDRVVDLKTRAIEAQTNIIDAQDKQITELSKEKNGILSSPWFYLTLGLVVGGYVAGGRR